MVQCNTEHLMMVAKQVFLAARICLRKKSYRCACWTGSVKPEQKDKTRHYARHGAAQSVCVCQAGGNRVLSGTEVSHNEAH